MKKRQYYIWFLLLFIFLLIVPKLGNYYAHVLNMVGINIVLCCSLNILFGYVGQFSVAHASFYGVGAYIAAILSMRIGFPGLLSFIPAGIGAFIIGVIVGIPALKVKGHYLALVTLGFVEICRLVFLNWESVTMGFGGISNIAFPRIGSFVFDSDVKFVYITAFFTIISVIVFFNLINSRVGRAFVAVRDNEEAAEAMGINSTYFKLMAFAICSMFSGIAGSIYAHLNAFINPESFTINDSLRMLSLIIIGGLGNLKGSIIAAIIFTITPEVIYYFLDYEPIIYAVFVLAILLFFPKGLGGLFEKLKTVSRI